MVEDGGPFSVEAYDQIKMGVREKGRIRLSVLWKGGFWVSRFTMEEGARYPRGFGVAFHRFDSATALVLPIPLNWVVGCVRNGYWRLARGPKSLLGNWPRKGDDLYWSGYIAGRRDGRDAER